MGLQKILLKLDSNLYSKDAIFKCIYWYMDRFLVDVSLKSNFYHITFTPKNEHNIHPNEIKSFEEKALQDFNDFNLRDIVSKETKDIRNLLIAKAFSPLDSEESPP